MYLGANEGLNENKNLNNSLLIKMGYVFHCLFYNSCFIYSRALRGPLGRGLILLLPFALAFNTMTMAQRPENNKISLLLIFLCQQKNKIRQMLISIPLAFVLIFIPFG